MFAEITKKSDILCVSVTSDIYYVSKKIPRPWCWAHAVELP
jgi:hypothetical protein